MIAVYKLRHLSLILLRIALQPRNPLFHSPPKPGTDFKPFIGGTVGDHGKLLRAKILEAEILFISGLKLFSLEPILEKSNFAR